MPLDFPTMLTSVPDWILKADKVRQKKDDRHKRQNDLCQVDNFRWDGLRQYVAVTEKWKIERAQIKEIEQRLQLANVLGYPSETTLVDAIKQMEIKGKRYDHLRHVDAH